MTTSADMGLVFGSLNATGNLSTHQYKIVQLASTAGTIKVATSATSKIIGVLVNDPTGGQAALVQVGGVARVLTEASVTIGGKVCSSSTGRAKLSAAVGDRLLGTAIDAAGSAGDYIRVLVSPSINGTSVA